ncbi:MAG: O-antigen ligase family protein, partial [Gemmatimonadetes bacterium]|nr:O-antigen ligase family protein [Gemmatimonadota bacterium]
VLLRSAVFSAVALALPIIWFRIDPASELTFLQSSIAGFFIEPVSLSELLRGYWFQTNNTLDARKAGAVFINANVASVYLCLFLAAAVGTLLRRPSEAWAQAAVPVLIAGILATGSRIGAVTAVGIAFVGLFMGRGKLGRWLPVAFAVTLLIAVPILIPTLLRFQPAVLLSDERILLWPLAVRRILDAPLLGGGFGDWEAWLGAGLDRFGVGRVLPPHNLVLHLGLWGGALALASFGGFLYWLARRIREGLRSGTERAFAVGTALLAIAVLLHAFFDNFFLFDWHVGPAAAGLLALLWTGRATPPAEPARPVTRPEAAGIGA